MLPVPEASMPAVEICSDRSAAGIMISAKRHIVVGHEHDLEQPRTAGSLLMILATSLASLMISLAL
jgi:hypothetical protein